MRVLVFAPHNDDEVLGVGGTIARHVSQGDSVYICELTSSLVEERKLLLQNEARAAHRGLGVSDTYFLGFTVVELPHENIRAFTGAVAEVVKQVAPDLVYMPFYGDMHTDHAAAANAIMVAVRPLSAPSVKAVYMYETLSETGWNYPTADKAFMPNVFVDISGFFRQKADAMRAYQSQLKQYPHPRSIEALEALARYRGSTIGVPMAEAFMCVREIIK